jgi:hypothetical protein
VEAMKSKDIPTVVATMKKIFDRMKTDYGKTPSALRSDNESSFKSPEWATMMSNYGVKHIFSSAHSPRSNGQAERSVQVVSRLIKKLKLQKGTNDWVSPLQKMVANYNDVWQRVIKMKPSDAIKGDDNKTTKDNIVEEVKSKNASLNTQKFYKDDKVRIALREINFEKLAYWWSKDIYTVDEVKLSKIAGNGDRYIVKDKDGKQLKTQYLDTELQLIKNVDNKVEGEEKYTVSKIIEPKNEKIGKNKYRKMFLVAFRNMRKKKDRVFLPRSQLVEDVPSIVKQFEETYKVKWGKTTVSFTVPEKIEKKKKKVRPVVDTAITQPKQPKQKTVVAKGVISTRRQKAAAAAAAAAQE